VALYTADIQSCSNTLQAGVALVDVQHSHIRRWVAQMQRQAHARIALILSGWRRFMSGWVAPGSSSNPTTGLRAPRAQTLPKPWAWTGSAAGQLPAATRWSKAPEDLARMELRDRCITELLLRLRPSSGELEGWTCGSAVAILD
jgi:integrase/recombinase XerC